MEAKFIFRKNDTLCKKPLCGDFPSHRVPSTAHGIAHTYNPLRCPVCGQIHCLNCALDTTKHTNKPCVNEYRCGNCGTWFTNDWAGNGIQYPAGSLPTGLTMVQF